MSETILLVDDENLFHLVFEDACSLLDITLDLRSLTSSDEAARLFDEWQTNPDGKPECVFVDLNIIGSSFDGIELIEKIKYYDTVPDNIYTYFAVDPANTKNKGSDYTAGIVFGVDQDSNIYILDAVHDKLNLSERYDMLKEKNSR